MRSDQATYSATMRCISAGESPVPKSRWSWSRIKYWFISASLGFERAHSGRAAPRRSSLAEIDRSIVMSGLEDRWSGHVEPNWHGGELADAARAACRVEDVGRARWYAACQTDR